jgi:flagellar M-ring protein FliF
VDGSDFEGRLGAIVNTLLSLLNRLGLARVAAMGVVAVLLLGFFAFLVMRAQTPQMAPLYSGLSFEDSSAIVAELQTQNVPFELRGEGDTILVARDQITALRMALAEDGLPQRGQVGYEIFDEQSTLGATSFVQNINNVRALEGELARTISSLSRIRSARVHLVLPERELFRRERKDPTASIVLAVRGELSAGEIRAIQHLVASAVEGMTPMRVSIVDDSGRLLASGGGNDGEEAMAAEAEERRLGVENRLRTNIEDLLANVVGAGRARVQVAVELDLERSTRTAETFDPEGQVVRSTQTRELENSATNGMLPEGVTVANELPGGANQADPTDASQEEGSTTEETTNFEISKVSETTVAEPGGVKKLSVAVVVDGLYGDDGAGNSVYSPRSDDEIEQIRLLVQTAAGFDESRGDKIEVVNMQFAERPELEALGTEGPGLFDFTRDDLMRGAEMLVTVLIALALVLFVMRPLLKRVLSPENPAPLALPAAAEIYPPGTAPGIAPGTAAGSPMVAQSHAQDVLEQAFAAPKPPAWIGEARTLGEGQAQTIKSVGTLVEENPKQAAMIVRDWLSSPA